MTTHPLPIPTPDLVLASVARFDMDPRAGPADRALHRVFSHHPLNTFLEDVLIKVVLLNGLYATNVFALVEMADHITGLQIDGDLSAGAGSLVDRIANLTIRDKTRRHYSFATKYCSWHRPEAYPIYDSLVEQLLWRYREQSRFADFKRPDLQDYTLFRSIIEAFIRNFSLGGLTFKQVDKFLWYTAKGAGG